MVNYVKKLAVNLAVKAEDICTFICLFSSFTAKVNENKKISRKLNNRFYYE